LPLRVSTTTCSVFHKSQFLSKRELSMLHSEQKALIDFLVLARSQNFVGFVTSTFSFFVQQYRDLHGFPAGEAVMVDVPKMPMVAKEMMRLGGSFTLYNQGRPRAGGR
jgi:GDP-fucose protein O-fucosyltransferase